MFYQISLKDKNLNLYCNGYGIHQFTVVCAILIKANDLEVMYLGVN